MPKVLAVPTALGVIVVGVLAYLVGSSAVASNRARSGSIALLESFDSRGLTSYEQTLLQPCDDRFDSGVRAAGFAPTNST